METQHHLLRYQERINNYLDYILPSTHTEPYVLHQAMRYSVLNGGKRLRSALIYATGEALHADPRVLDKCSAAIELIHAFSLVHDDLPAIDNDALRRGKPSCHVAFGEATAVLTGDALLALAFELLASISKKQLMPETNLKMIQILSHYIGSLGMAGGEALDVAVMDRSINLSKLALIYKLKTSYLIAASILLGALSANCTEKEVLDNLEKFGLYLGLAFQIHDDILDIESKTEILGKPQGSDEAKHKPTYPSLLGLTKAKQKAKNVFEKAVGFLKKSHIKDEELLAISYFVLQREY